MKRTFCLVVLAFAVAICSSQSSRKPASAPDLRNFSSGQLKACYSDKSICGANDVYEISAEMEKRLPALPTEQLVNCFADWRICGVENDIETGWAVSAEVGRRGDPQKLLVRYWIEPDEGVRDGIIHTAVHFNTPEVTAFMKKVVATGKGDEDALYWPADYLAKRCDSDALKWLSARNGRPEGCILWAPTVARFGKCRYRQAIPYLVDNSLDDACLNIVDAAEDDLRAMYPHSPREFSSIEAMRKYYCARALQEGFKADCSAK
ncbi:MAG: hypothetical protein WAL75_17970 [Terracidiphilus sp.]